MKKVLFLFAVVSFIGMHFTEVFAQADQKLIAKANSGDVKSMRKLAFCYERGAGVPLDSATALQWYQKAANLGDGEAWLRVSRYYLEGKEVPADTARYFAIRKEWADKGLPNGIAALGYAYRGGFGVMVDTVRYLELIQLAAGKGSPWALSTIGDLYSYGHYGYPVDYKKAEQYYKKAMKAGDETYNIDLAYLYTNMGDFKNGRKYMEDALKWNDPSAHALNVLYTFYGNDVTADERKAQQMADELVSKYPYSEGTYEIASRVYLFAQQYRDETKGVEYAEKGAALGNNTCRLRLVDPYISSGHPERAISVLNDVLSDRDASSEEKGVVCIAMSQIYGQGMGVGQNDNEAVAWLRRGVESYGSAQCASALAEYYANSETTDPADRNNPAIMYYSKAFELGDTDALVNLGRYCMYVNDVESALNAFRQYADCGKADGYYWMAVAYSQLQNEAKMLSMINEGDKKGSALCREVLGVMYEEGSLGDAPDYKKAEKYYLASGTGRSYDKLGVLYLNGMLGKQSEKELEKGVHYIQKAADLGYMDAAYHLGYIYESGAYLNQVDHEKALSYYKYLADNDSPVGNFKLGLYYELGDGGLQADSVKAIEYYTKAADMGYGEAMCYLGDFYRIGQYLPLDRAKAFELYTKADSVGEEIGTYYVARSYMEGCGVAVDTAAAIPYLKAAASQGVGKAAYLLAEFYNKGLGGIAADGDTASKYYMLAHQNGSGEASNYIGSSLITEGHYKEAVEYLYTGARRGNYDAMVLLALCEQEGVGMEANPEDAYLLLENVTRRVDHAGAYYQLGRARMYGIGCQQSETLGKRYLDTAAMLGNMRAMSMLGTCYLEGYGCQPDTTEALRWLERAADGGSLEACNKLGYIYEGREEYEKAVEYYRRSSDGGNYEGMCCLGLCYEKGWGVILSYKKAYELYKTAADAGYHRGYVMLAYCYLEGINVEEDHVKALEMFEKAGEAGSILGMYNAGLLLEDGEDGVQRDLKRAKYWFKKAADAGYEPAAEALKRLK